MARINIEDQFWIEITAVTRQLKGDESRAVGDAVRLFRTAQQRAKQGRIVSDEDWRIGDFTDALIGIFAIKVDGGYEVVGAKKHFGWLKERAEAGRKGGIKSGESRRSDIADLDEANGSNLKQPEPSYSPSYSTGKTRINTTDSVGGGEVDFESLEALYKALPSSKRDKWIIAYSASFLSEQLEACFAYYTASGADTPRAIVGWERAISAWLDKNWKQVENRELVKDLISNLGKKIEVQKQQRST